ncbi:Catenin-beta-like protein [Papiliotrema laurentii]|uniref:Catenin-beta-like protein n=1 Tax=Papiliotrema laurentii TaxID=5418 RepID=A0AAD9CSM8_PAPLA|nr:Catenin-beta-like protein [Papiliotrema laurentii]
MDVDKMFKLPALPASAGQKRKMPDAPTPEMLKKYRVAEPEPEAPAPVSNGKGKSRAATVGEEDEEESYGPVDGGDEDGDADDDEGRFFGGGLNSEQNQILDIFDKAGDEEETAVLTVPALRRQLAKFERIVTKNAEQRGKYPDDPSKFIESEADLDTALKQFLPLTQNPGQFYPEIVKSGAAALLANLLSHENTDIAIDVIEIIQELTDEDVGAGGDDMDEEDEEDAEKAAQARMAMAEFIDELLNNSILDLLVANLGRLDESEDSDSRGVYNILGVFENLLSFIPPLADQIVSETTLLPWLLKRVDKKEFDSNKQYASQILAILLQQSRENVLKLGELDGMEVILKSLSQYRKKDPSDGEEVEFMEDMFNCLCTALAEPEMKEAFLEAEGVELMIIMMKEKLLARTRSIKVLDYAMQTEDGSKNCERFVEVLGLKTFFSAFMGKGEGKKKKLNATSPFEDEEHMLGILVSLFTNLESDTPARIRLIAKFIENNYEKVERLLEMREVAENRLKPVDKDIARERRVMEANEEEIDEETEAEWFLRRAEAGLSALQNADYILGWVCMEDDGAMAHAKTMLGRKDQSLANVVAVLEDFARNIGDESEGDDGEVPLQKVVIQQLVNYLNESL